MVNIDNKDAPSLEWINTLRKRFPTEQEIDRILTRKMTNRSGPGYVPVSVSSLVRCVGNPIVTSTKCIRWYFVWSRLNPNFLRLTKRSLGRLTSDL